MSATSPTQPLTQAAGGIRMGLAARAVIFALTLFVEKLLLNFFVNFRAAQAARGVGTVVRVAQHFGFRFAVSFVIALALLLYVRGDGALREVDAEARYVPVRRRWIALHGALIVPVAASLYNLYGTHGVRLPLAFLAAAAVTLTVGAVAALLVALAPWPLWRRGAAAVGDRWLYAALAALAGTGAIVLSQDLWAPTARVTFELVHWTLAPILPALQADPATRVLRAPHFAVAVSRVCSGLEGMGLMLAFVSAWLIYFRAEYRFPRALLLIPVGLLSVFALNVARIAALVVIGNAGHPAIAVYGFHSQAGWIAFNGAACGIALVSRRSRWLSRSVRQAPAASTTNPTAAYLMPFLAILAAGMVSRAVSGRFETWYALRLLAGGIALAVYWPRRSTLDWRFGWRGIAAGIAAFALWLAGAHLFLTPRGIPPALAAMSAPARILWIGSRAATAIALVPVAEELAYRGYLLRRLKAEDFENVPFGSVGWIPLLVSAFAFGALQGQLWLPATCVGILYGLLLIRTQRIGEAVMAHATTSLLLAACVLLGYQWQLW